MPGPKKLPKGVGTLAEAAKRRGRGGQMLRRARVGPSIESPMTARGSRLGKAAEAVASPRGELAQESATRMATRQRGRISHDTKIRAQGIKWAQAARSAGKLGSKMRGMGALGVLGMAQERRKQDPTKTPRQARAEKRRGKRM